MAADTRVGGPRRRYRRAIRTAAIATACLALVAVALGADGVRSAPPTPVQLGRVGAWCWFADPRAIYHDGRTYAGWVNGQGHVVVVTLHGGVVEHRADIGQPAPDGRRDDHDNPSLLVEPSGRITAFFSHHNGPAMYWRRTRRPWDTSSWGELHTVTKDSPHESTYPNPVRLADESAAYLFWRGDTQPVFARRAHDRWSAARKLVSSDGTPYMKVASNDRDAIALAFTNGHPRDAVTNIYYAGYRGGMLEHADGRPIVRLGKAPLRPSQADEVYDAAQHDGRRAWVHDVALTAAGRPVIVYATFSEDGRSHRYEYARWTGSEWETHDIAEAGGSITTAPVERLYSAGVVLDHRDPRVVYASVPQGAHRELERLVTHDGGRSWTATAITSESGTDNVRPFVPRGLPKGSGELLWMRGFYDRFAAFKTSLVATASPTPPG
jgi:hypothetical protein